MQIVSNSTGLLADLTVQSAPDGRDYCVVVIKGTFQTSGDGKLTLAHHQLPLTAVDLHEGEPRGSALVLESDFALEKPLTDVVVLGRAVVPEGRAVTEMVVRLEIAGQVKEAVVVGDRRAVRLRRGESLPPADPDASFGGDRGSPPWPRPIAG